ncbi:unnamed protein product [Owenia fusiformis]|uniref:Amino acid transporter n=1 Tax=Owenia fusiformis TaxID=6347 RepID=A0A8J1UD38_OWEFU|nr:unnamed protein product [Owenia fusiformis]
MKPKNCGRGCLCTKASMTSGLKQNLLLILTLCGIVIGFFLGLGVRSANPSDGVIMWIGLPGELFIRMLKMIILPLIVASLITGVSSLDPRSNGKIGGVTIGYICLTQAIGIIIGIVLGLVMRPGEKFNQNAPPGYNTGEPIISYSDLFADLLRNMVPENIVQACMESIHTSRKEVIINSALNITEIVKERDYRDGMNALGIIIFSIVFGIAASATGDSAKPVLNFFSGVNDIVFKMMTAIIWYSPIGLGSLVAYAVLKITDLYSAFRSLGYFSLTATIGLCIHSFIVLPGIYFIACRKNPFMFMFAVFPSVLAGCVPASSMAALPYLFLNTAGVGIDVRVSKFVLPLSINTNKDGSVIFICVSVLFVSQSIGITFTATQIIVLGCLCFVSSFGVAMVPSASLVIVVLLGSALNMPLGDSLALILTLEWLNDRLRTVTNVLSHATGCALVDAICRNDLDNTNCSDDTRNNDPEKGARCDTNTMPI